MVKRKIEHEFESDSENSDSDTEELQEAFAAGKLKPGLNEVIEKTQRIFANNVPEMKRILNILKLNLPWIETLDLLNKQAPLAPEIAAQIHEQEARRANELKNNAKLQQFAPSDDPVLNDFKREMIFHRQAQAAVLDAIPRLKEMGIVTKRPDDYYAEMAKTDEHMQKVRQALMKKQAETQQRERVRQLRIQRKEGKAMHTQAKVRRQEDKKEMLDQVKKVRKGLSNNLDFLDGGKKNNPGKNQLHSKKAQEKQNYKNKKFGFGGKKKGLKRNTKNSSADVNDYRTERPKMGGKKGNFGPGKSKGNFGPGNPKGKFGPGNSKGNNSRPGKNRRNQIKNKNKK